MSEMDEQQPKPSDTQGASPEPAGVMLRRERERQGMSLEDVATQLNLRPAVVAGLEQDRFDEVPIVAYRRGYMRAYARLLGMDDAAIVSAFDATHGRADIDRKVSPVNAARTPSRAGAWIFRLFTLLVVVGLISLTLLWWQSREGNDVLGGGDDPIAVDSRDGAPSSDAGGSANELASNTDTELPPVPTDADTPREGATAAGAPDGEDVAATAETTPPSLDARQAEQIASIADSVTGGDSDGAAGGEMSADRAAAGDTAADDTTLSLTFNGESWTQIIDASGEAVFSSLQQPGTEATVTGEPPFRLTIGESAGVTLVYRGEEIDLDQYTSGNVARFTLGD